MTHLTAIATVVGVLGGLFGIIKGIMEYIQQGKQRRAEKFFEATHRFDQATPENVR